ncbi:3-isopropylmalate dehydrogenase [Bacteroidia bacterium]|nr:3-isopropylmalate dehydrogenase [Bacteroidia bacterium]
MKITDNSSHIFDNEKDFNNLIRIANQSIDEIKLDENPNLLVFPQKWRQGMGKKDFGKMPQICSLHKHSDCNYKLSTGNVMGFVGINDTELTISSRFCHDKGDFFLHYMLAKVFNINVVNLDLSKGNGNYYDFLPYLFPAYLQNALSQGLFKQYKRNQYNDANVKGVIDVSRHIRINIPFAGKIAYNTREHSYDNDITQLVRHTIEYLRVRPIGHTVLTSNDDTRQNTSKIEFATPTFKKSDLQKVLRANQKLLNHPYFTKYKDLQILCKLILQREYTTFGNEKDKIHGILFDGAWLWEEYIATVFNEHKKGITHKIGTDKLFEKDDVGKNQGIIPDFIAYKNRPLTASFIGDTKYKHIDTKNNREDYFQIITYMYRYSCKTGYLIFPIDKENKEDYMKGRERVIAGGKENASKVIELGLKIPQIEKTFSDFQNLIKESEIRLIKTILCPNSNPPSTTS